MIVDAVTLAYLLNHCAGPVAAPGTMAAIVAVESGKHPWAINDNATRQAYYPATYADAVALAHSLNAQGHYNLDLGLAQINEGNLATYHASISQILKPCFNLGVASLILRNGWSSAVGRYGTAPAALRYVISGAVETYNSGSMFGSPSYAQSVVDAYFSSDVRTIEAIAYGLRARAITPLPPQKKKHVVILPAGRITVASDFAGLWNH